VKSILVIILSLLQLTSVTGIVLHRHYCMGKPAGWGLVQNTAQVCGQCGMKKSATENKGCCSDENTFIKLSSDQKINDAGYRFSEPVKELHHLVPLTNIVILSSYVTGLSFRSIIHSPPYPAAMNLYVRNCVFRI
jgi:hypothetical protein